MALESAATIDQLNISNPVETDPLGDTDDHLRMIKAALKGTFPKLIGATQASAEDLDWVVDTRADVDDLNTHAIRDDKATQSIAGSLSLTTPTGAAGPSTFDAPVITQGGLPIVPKGVITWWWGATNNVPTGWALCDGTNGTPNLVGRFLVPAGGTLAPFATGGANSVTVTTTPAGAHNHGGQTGLAGAHGHTGTTAQAGSHAHTGKVVGTAITVDQMPSHDHGLTAYSGADPQTGGEIESWGAAATATVKRTSQTGGGQAHDHTIQPDGNHDHPVTVSPVGDHPHSITGAVDHQHQATVPTVPAYTALCLIMKIT